MFQYVCHGGQQYIFGFESSVLVDCPGILVSSWSKSSLVSKDPLSYTYAKALVRVHGNGFGRRVRSDCIGMNLYCNRRESNRPHPSPFVSGENVKDHQYWRNNWKFPLIQPILEKRLHDLTSSARILFQKLNPPMFEMFGESCRKQIVTTGKIPEISRFSALAFVNTCHVDKCDRLYRNLLAGLKKNIESTTGSLSTKAYKRKLVGFKGFCLPTTCAYQFVHATSKVQQATFWNYWREGSVTMAIGKGGGHRLPFWALARHPLYLFDPGF